MRKICSILISLLILTVFTSCSLIMNAFSTPESIAEPKIKYGEFDFTLTYELNGQICVIKDTIVCEFDGIKYRGTAGNERKWKATLKSGKEELTLLDLRSSNDVNELKQTVLELYFSYGSGAYYMGDTKNSFVREAQSFDWVSYKFKTEDGRIMHSGYEADVAFEKYKIRLISWECEPPIENSFPVD